MRLMFSTIFLLSIGLFFGYSVGVYHTKLHLTGYNHQQKAETKLPDQALNSVAEYRSASAELDEMRVILGGLLSLIATVLFIWYCRKCSRRDRIREIERDALELLDNLF